MEELEMKSGELQTTSEILNLVQSKLSTEEEKIRSLRSDRVQFQKKISEQKRKISHSSHIIESFHDQMQEERDEMDLRKKEIEIKEKEIEYLQIMLNDDEIKTFENGKYTDNIRLTIMELLSMNVSFNKVNDVIRAVIKRLTNKSIDRLPSIGLRSHFLIEARQLADIQVGNALLQDCDLTSVLGNTLHGDGTTKYHRHYQNFQVTTAAGKS